MKELNNLLDECKSAFIKTDDYRILKTYRTRSDRFSFDERQSVINSINICFKTVFERLKTEFPCLTKFDLQYCALYVVEAETVAIAECLCVSKDAVRMRKYRLRDKLSDAWYVTLFGEPQRNNLESVTPDSDEPQTSGIPLSPNSTQKQKTMKTKMNFGDAVKQCYRKCFTYEGRASRAEFWYFFLFAFILNLFSWAIYSFARSSIMPLVSESSSTLIKGAYLLINIIVEIATVIPMLSVTVRRLHDRDLPGWIILLIYVFPKLIWSLFLFSDELFRGDIQVAAGKHMDNMIALIFAYVIIFALYVTSIIVRLVMMSKPGDIGPNNYGADPIEVPNPKGTGLAIFKKKKVIICLVIAIIAICGIYTTIGVELCKVRIESNNKSEPQAIEIVKGIEDFIMSNESSSISYNFQFIYPAKIDSEGNVTYTPTEDGQMPEDAQKRPYYCESECKYYEDGRRSYIFGEFRNIIKNYFVYVEKDEDDYWIILCNKIFNSQNTLADQLKLKVNKDTYQPITLTSIRRGCLAVIYDDIIYGADPN